MPAVAKKVGFAALAVPALRVVLAVITHTPAHPAAGLVHSWIKVARLRVTIAVAL